MYTIHSYKHIQGYTELHTRNTQLNRAIHTFTGLYRLYRAIKSHTLLNRAIHSYTEICKNGWKKFGLPVGILLNFVIEIVFQLM